MIWLRLHPLAIRTLEALALDNAIEGCVFETYGAMVVEAQARHAGDKVVRVTLRRIAADEARHAALSWQVARWCQQRLAPQALQQIAEAQLRAVETLAQAAGHEPPALVAQKLGVPTAPLAQRLVAGLDAHLWQRRAGFSSVRSIDSHLGSSPPRLSLSFLGPKISNR